VVDPNAAACDDTAQDGCEPNMLLHVMHAYRKPIVTVAVHAAQQAILAVHRRVGFGVMFPVMHISESIFNTCIDQAIQDGLSGQSHAGV